MGSGDKEFFKFLWDMRLTLGIMLVGAIIFAVSVSSLAQAILAK